MKRFFYLIYIFAVIFTASYVYANDLDEILRNLESPDVDYHVDKEIKTIVIPQILEKKLDPQDTTKKSSFSKTLQNSIKRTTSNNQHSQSSHSNINNQITNQKLISTKSSTAATNKTISAQVKDNKNDNHIPQNNQSPKSSSAKDNKNVNIAQKRNQSENSKIKDDKNSDPKSKSNGSSTPKSEINQLAKTLTKQSQSATAKNPIQIYKLYKFFRNMPFVKDWQEKIINSLALTSVVSYQVLDYWEKNPIETDEDEEDDDEEESDDDDEEEDDKPVDYSIYNNIYAEAEKLQKEKKWPEIQDLFEENPKAADTPTAQKYLLNAALQEESPNIHALKNYASNILADDPSNAVANYAMALFHYKNPKKQNIKLAKKFIAEALKGPNPSEAAIKLSNEINSLKWLWLTLTLIIIIVLIIIVFIILKRKKNRSITKTENSEIPPETISDNQSKLNESTIDSPAPDTSNDPNMVHQPINSEEIQENPVIQVNANNLNNYENDIQDLIIVKQPSQSSAESANTNNKSVNSLENSKIEISEKSENIIEEIIEKIEEEPEEIVEEVIEEIEEEPEEIVEEVIEEIEEEPEEIVEEVIEEIVEIEEESGEDDYIISEERLLSD